MDNMIRIYENVLDKNFCKKLIDKFEASEDKMTWGAEYRKFSDMRITDNQEFWKDEIPVCLDAFTKIIERYKCKVSCIFCISG